MVPGDRLVCAFVTPHRIGDRFSEWPLHVTIVPWFRVDIVSDRLAAHMAQRLGTVRFFQVDMAGEAIFGRDKLVNRVKRPTPFGQVEKVMREYLQHEHAWLVDGRTQARYPYQPHVTAQKNERLHEGDSFTCSGLTLVEQRDGFKEIVAEIAFQS